MANIPQHPVVYSGEQCKKLWELLRISQAMLAEKMGEDADGYPYTVDQIRYWFSRKIGMDDYALAQFLRVAEEILTERIKLIERAEVLRQQLEQHTPTIEKVTRRPRRRTA